MIKKTVFVIVVAMLIGCGGFAVVHGETKDDAEISKPLPDAAEVESSFMATGMSELLWETDGAQFNLGMLQGDYKAAIRGGNVNNFSATETIRSRVGSRSGIKGIVAHTMFQYYCGKASAKSAIQISQVANETMVKMQTVQILQNQRIIELLERQSAPKKK